MIIEQGEGGMIIEQEEGGGVLPKYCGFSNEPRAKLRGRSRWRRAGSELGGFVALARPGR